MLLETVATAIRSIPAKPSAGGPVFVDISNLPNSLSLIGDGTGWSAKGNTVTLKPATSQVLPVWYQLTFEIDLGTGYSLLGAQLFTPGEASSIVYFAASGGTVTINLMSNMPGSAEPLSYTFTLGFLASDGTQLWFDPTITFEPQG